MAPQALMPPLRPPLHSVCPTQIKNKAVVNENTTGSVAALQAEIRTLRGELDEFKCACGIACWWYQRQ